MDPSQKKQDDELLQLVTFSIGEEEFGVNILKVQEIIRTMEITKVPRAQHHVTVFIRAPAFGALQQQKTDRPERVARLLRQ